MARADELFERLSVEGEAGIYTLIREQVSEELYLDYKRSANDGRGSSLHNNDRSNLGKAISGFANSEGGVIVWGVDCKSLRDKGDVPSAPRPISEPDRFKSWLEQATSGLTVPPHSGVAHRSIPSTIANEGFVLSFVPGGLHAPYQTTEALRYFMRAGSSFAPVPHAVLAGMFGRRPQPLISYNFITAPPQLLPGEVVECQVAIMLINMGAGICEDLFLNMMFKGDLGENCKMAFSNLKEDTWIGQFSFGRMLSLISRPGIRLPPEGHLVGPTLTLTLRPPFTKSLHISGLCGGAGSPSTRLEIQVTPERIADAYSRMLTAAKGTLEDKKAAATHLHETLFPDRNS
jgi:hypothetical protein